MDTFMMICSDKTITTISKIKNILQKKYGHIKMTKNFQKKLKINCTALHT